jgi:hypothetical protein
VTVKLGPLDIVRYAVKCHPNSLLKDEKDLQFRNIEFIEEDDTGCLIFRGEVYKPAEEK